MIACERRCDGEHELCFGCDCDCPTDEDYEAGDLPYLEDD